MLAIELQGYDDVTALLDRAKSLCSLETLLPTVDAALRFEWEQQFATKGERFGKDVEWTALKERYVKFRGKYGNPAGRTEDDILYYTGALRRSFTVAGDAGHVMELVSDVQAVIGSNVEYASLHHEGAEDVFLPADPWWLRAAFYRGAGHEAGANLFAAGDGREKSDPFINIFSRSLWEDGEADETVNADLEAFAERVLSGDSAGAGAGVADEVPF